ncbi:MAG: TrmH family RNA methyltransferase [Flavobacteriaceae bacterium]
MEQISSKENIKFKNLKKLLSKSKKRRDSKSFIVEGFKDIILCQNCDYNLVELFISDEINLENYELSKFKIIILSKKLYCELAYKKKGDGFLAVFESKDFKLENINLPKNPLVLVLESPEKPGNIGAALRTADAAGVDAVFIADPRTEIYNPNIIRSSLGSIFTIQICLANTIEIINFFKAKKIRIFSTLIEKSIDYKSVNYKEPCAIIIGKESSSISKEWIENSDKLIKIPMKGKMDSLNLSISAAIVIFEASNQRESCES